MNSQNVTPSWLNNIISTESMKLRILQVQNDDVSTLD